MSQERLQKILSQAGLGSRRAMEEWIEKGLVRVNGVVAKIGESAGPEDKISVNHQVIANPLARAEKIRILIYHKPIGEICSRSDPEHPQTVFDQIPVIRQGRWVMVGRLDINTSGLLIFTNSGELANQLMHPRFGLEREYAVRVHGQVDKQIIKNLREGVQLEDGLAKFERLEFQGGEGTNSWYHVVLTEGKNREVRRLWESQEVQVSRLIRIRYGRFELPRSLSRGQFLELSEKEVNDLLAVYLPQALKEPVKEVRKARERSSASAKPDPKSKAALSKLETRGRSASAKSTTWRSASAKPTTGRSASAKSTTGRSVSAKPTLRRKKPSRPK